MKKFIVIPGVPVRFPEIRNDNGITCARIDQGFADMVRFRILQRYV